VSLLTTLAVAPLTWLATSSSGLTQAVAAVGAAVVTVGGPFLVSWVHERRVAKERRETLREPESTDSLAGSLRADRRIVPFIGRDTELTDLIKWCSGDREPKVRLLVGAGEVGKTRLALELGEHWKEAGWQVTVVAAGQEGNASTTLRDATKRSSILLIVDYAETRTGLADLLRSVAASSAHVRVLLIARSAGEWWWQLRSDVPAMQDLIGEYQPLKLSAQMNPVVSPTELINKAMRSFAEELGVPVPTVPPAIPPGEVPVLTLHAAALLAVLQSRDQPGAGRAVAGQYRRVERATSP
jgi:hypothetical protein